MLTSLPVGFGAFGWAWLNCVAVKIISKKGAFIGSCFNLCWTGILVSNYTNLGGRLKNELSILSAMVCF
jgi:hypothetical protein